MISKESLLVLKVLRLSELKYSDYLRAKSALKRLMKCDKQITKKIQKISQKAKILVFSLGFFYEKKKFDIYVYNILFYINK